MASNRIVSASDFKAKCLDILDRIRNKEWERVVVTKPGVPSPSSCRPQPLREKSGDYAGFCEDPLSLRPRLI